MFHEDTDVALKTEAGRDGGIGGIGSPSEPELEPASPAAHAIPPPKRKGGRKPIYATSEERKQRNRQAQAAFRERRTEYIKQLETTIQHHEAALQSVQQRTRHAAEECLMLRYQNALLERILLDKGIDIQAELDAQSGSPRPPTATTAVTTLATAAVSTPPLPHPRPFFHPSPPTPRDGPRSTRIRDPDGCDRTAAEARAASRSPPAHPTPASHRSSPISTSSGLATHGVLTPPAPRHFMLADHDHEHARPGVAHYLDATHLPLSPTHPHPHPHPHTVAMMSSMPGAVLGDWTPQYYAPASQKHVFPLGHGHAASGHLLDDPDGSEPSAALRLRLPSGAPKATLDGTVPLATLAQPPLHPPRCASQSGAEAIAPLYPTMVPLPLSPGAGSLGPWQTMAFSTPLFSFPPRSDG